MKDINPRAWAYTPAKRFVRTDHHRFLLLQNRHTVHPVHMLDAWGDVFCRLKIHDRLGVRFEKFIEFPHYYLHCLRSRSVNFIDDRRLDLWGDIFCKYEVHERLKITFKQFLVTPNYFLTLNEA